MIIVSPTKLINGEKYYIKSASNEKSKQIAICKQVIHIKDDDYLVHFSDISEIKKTNGKYGNSGLHYGEGYRHSYSFKFYKVHSIEYNKKIEKLYKDAINTYLQQNIGDCHFFWYK